VLIGLRAAGAEIGWGFQLQSPIFVAAMIYVLFAVGLHLSGVFTFGVGMTRTGGNLASLDGYAGSFFSGALATLVATPCTAPFMAAALGYAITQPWYISLAVFAVLGLGLAFPYLMISFSPAARRVLPKPGAWMLRLEQILAFPVYGTAVWLMFVLSLETGPIGTTAVLAGLVALRSRPVERKQLARLEHRPGGCVCGWRISAALYHRRQWLAACGGVRRASGARLAKLQPR
jgi:thiol:disulfide interchange protein